MKTIKKSDEEIKEFFNKMGKEWIEGKYINSNKRTLVTKDSYGYKYLESYGNTKASFKPSRFGYNNPYTIENIKLWLEINNMEIEWNDNLEFVDAEYDHKWLCKKCNSGFKYSWNKVCQKRGCPYCSGRRVNDTNSIRVKRHDLIKYLKFSEDADKHTQNSNKKVICVCPDCGFEKEMIIANLNKRGFKCNICNDNISIPEKFTINILNQLNVDFETQKLFKWSRNKRYDFLININKENYIIETHGLQHYEKSFEKCIEVTRTLEEEIENDKVKKELALNNEIKEENYIVVDCRYSKLEWIKNNIMNSRLAELFDLNNIDWELAWEQSQHSLCVKTWYLWNNKKESETIRDIIKIIGLGKFAIIKYLKVGNELGKCVYVPKEEMKKCGVRNGLKNSKVVLQLSDNGDLLKTFYSASEASRQTNIPQPYISACCRGKMNKVGGFIWKYA